MTGCFTPALQRSTTESLTCTLYLTMHDRDSTAAAAAKLCHTKPTSKYNLTISRQKLKEMNAHIHHAVHAACICTAG